jgi:hypothetical protein
MQLMGMQDLRHVSKAAVTANDGTLHRWWIWWSVRNVRWGVKRFEWRGKPRKPRHSIYMYMVTLLGLIVSH